MYWGIMLRLIGFAKNPTILARSSQVSLWMTKRAKGEKKWMVERSQKIVSRSVVQRMSDGKESESDSISTLLERMERQGFVEHHGKMRDMDAEVEEFWRFLKNQRESRMSKSQSDKTSH